MLLTNKCSKNHIYSYERNNKRSLFLVKALKPKLSGIFRYTPAQLKNAE